jgi:hypothetical protein
MTITDNRIAELEAKLNAAQAELQALKSGKSGKVDMDAMPSSQALTTAPEKRDVSVTAVLNERTDLPNLRELEKLYAAVRHLSPWPEALHDRYDDGRPFRGFSSAFRWVQNMPRADRPNGRVALSYWQDVASHWLRARNAMTSDPGVNSLVLACLAAGDVVYCPANAQLGVTWELGLLEFGGKPASPDAWRRVMAGGAASILPPSSPARRTPPLSPVRVTVGY